MLKLLLSLAFNALLLFALFGQSTFDSVYVSTIVQGAAQALEKDQPDSLAYYLKQIRESYLQAAKWDGYNVTISNIAQASFPKWNENVALVKTGLHSLQMLHKDIQNQYGTHSFHNLEVCYQVARGFYYQGLGSNDIVEAHASYDSCYAYIKQNLAQLETMPPNESALIRANHYNMLGVSLNASGQAAEALEQFEKVLQIRLVKLDANDDRLASIYFNLGNAYSNLKLYNKALDVYTKGIKIREAAAGTNRARLADMYFNVGVMYDEKGEYDNAISYYNRAATIYQENAKDFSDLDEKIATILNSLAGAYQNKGAYQESAIYNNQSIQKYEQLGGANTTKIAAVYINQALLAALKGDHKKAIELNEKALSLYQQHLNPDDPQVILVHNNLGIAYADNKEYERALTELQSALQLIAKDSAQQEMYANLHSEVANVYFKIGNLKEAKAYNLQALAMLQKIFSKKNYQIAVIYNNLAKIAAAEKDLESALKYIQQALAENHQNFDEYDNPTITPSAEGYFQYNYFVESLMLKAAFMQGSPHPDALLGIRDLYHTVDSVLTEVQNELIASEDKIRLSEKMYALSEAAIENCLQLANATGDRRYWEEAFIYAEKSKNTVLTQSITANRAKRFAGIPDSLIALEDRLQSDIRYFKLQLLDSASNIAFQNELFIAQRDYRALVQDLEKNYPYYYQLKYDRGIPSVSALQRTLPEQTALLSYFIGDSTLYSFVITSNDFQVYHSPLRNDFFDQLTGLRKTIHYQLNEDYVKLASDLYQQLFFFHLPQNIQSLLIIPDGNLSKLPFETLLTEPIHPSNDVDFSQLPYLLHQYQIGYALSGTLFYQKYFNRSNFSEAQEGLLAYAPVFDELQDIATFSNGTRNPLFSTNSESAGRTITADGRYVAALPATAGEVQSIAAVFKEKGQKTAVFLFQNANENQLKHNNNMARSQYLHIATHGFINEEQPDLSGLLLFPDTSAREDHILYSGEVYNLNLNADLVVLSACETGLGKVANGEGLLGLSRAFFYAGADNLIVSLWKVQDQATADLMVHFYQAHLNGKEARFSNPLCQAKRNMILTEKFNHPYYWSAFVLIGQ